MLSGFSPPALCNICQSIFADHSFDWWKVWFDEQRPIFHTFSQKHHPSEESFREAVTQGCWLCTTIINRQKKFKKSETRLFEPIYYRLTSTSVNDNHFFLSFDNHTYFEIYNIESWTPGFEHAYKSKLDTWTGNDHAISLAQHWLDTCRKEHCCEQTIGPDWYPTRLLDVADEPIKLVITKDEPEIAGPYATLSHCWGDQEFLVLESNSISGFLAGIPSNKLPRSFRETITTIRALGIRYLWIDSYCILQGSESDKAAHDDWIQEAGRMEEVYSHSCLNIGSAHANNPYNGLFHHRKLYDEETMFLTWQPTKTSPVKRYAMIMDRYELCDSLSRGGSGALSESTLLKRGWVVQEMILSQRMLSFTDRQILWHCGEMAACEDFPEEWCLSTENAAEVLPFWSLVDSTRLPFKRTCLVNVSQRYIDFQKTLDLEKEWFRILNTFNRASLTYPDKDIFKAVEGIGKRVAGLVRNVYAHGILGGTLPYALTWNSPVTTTSPGSQNRAPTWHWASNEQYPTDDMIYKISTGHGYIYKPLAYAFLSDSCQQLAPERSSNGFWPYLICIGRLLTLRFKRGEDSGATKDNFFVYSSDTGQEFKIDFDICKGKSEVGREPGVRYTFLPLVRESSGYEVLLYVQGIILRQTGNGLHERAGFAEVSDDDSDMQECISKTKPQLFVIE